MYKLIYNRHQSAMHIKWIPQNRKQKANTFAETERESGGERMSEKATKIHIHSNFYLSEKGKRVQIQKFIVK